MDDDEIRELLAVMRRMGIGVPHGHVGIARSVVQEAGLELAAIDSWVERHGGQVVRSEYQSRGLRPGPRRPPQDTSHYLIPRDALLHD